MVNLPEITAHLTHTHLEIGKEKLELAQFNELTKKVEEAVGIDVFEKGQPPTTIFIKRSAIENFLSRHLPSHDLQALPVTDLKDVFLHSLTQAKQSLEAHDAPHKELIELEGKEKRVVVLKPSVATSTSALSPELQEAETFCRKAGLAIPKDFQAQMEAVHWHEEHTHVAEHTAQDQADDQKFPKEYQSRKEELNWHNEHTHVAEHVAGNQTESTRNMIDDYFRVISTYNSLKTVPEHPNDIAYTHFRNQYLDAVKTARPNLQ